MANDIQKHDDAMPPAFMREAATKAQADMDVKLRPFIHLCQSKSPEVEKDEIAQAGEFFVRNIDINLGESFQAVILAHQLRWVRWGDKGTDAEGRVLWQAPDGQVPRDKLPETLWRTNPDGESDLPPVANETHALALVVIKDGKIDQEVGLIYANLDRTATKVAKGALKNLAAENRKGWHPAAVVFTFASEKVVNGKFVYKGWTIHKSANVTDEDTYYQLEALYRAAQAEKSRVSGDVAQAMSDEVTSRNSAPRSEREAADDYVDKYAVNLPDTDGEPPF